VGYPVEFVNNIIDTTHGGNEPAGYIISQAKGGLIEPAVKAFFGTKNFIAFIEQSNGF